LNQNIIIITKSLLVHHLLHLLISFLTQEMELLLSTLESLSQLLDVLSLDFQISLIDLLILREISDLTFTVHLLAFTTITLHHGLVCSHLGFGSLILLLRFELFNISTEFSDHSDKSDVLSHDVHVVLLMNLLLFLKSLFEGIL
jgi:hypothetical protein